jgi:hypothetical protein
MLCCDDETKAPLKPTDGLNGPPFPPKRRLNAPKAPHFGADKSLAQFCKWSIISAPDFQAITKA